MISTKGIVFFDGNCAFCNRWVKLLIQWDVKALYKFCSLTKDSELIKELEMQGLKNPLDSIILIRNGIFYHKSNAIIQILADLWTIGFVFKVFYLIPRSLRDGIYDLVANNRYRLNGKNKACPMPDFDNSHRIIENKEALHFLLRRFS